MNVRRGEPIVTAKTAMISGPILFLAILTLAGLPTMVLAVFLVVRRYRSGGHYLQSVEHLESAGPPEERMADWNRLADSNDLRRTDDYPRTRIRVEGELEGISTLVHRTYHSGTTTVVYEFDLGHRVPEGFSATPQESPGPLQRWLDQPDVVAGDDALDRAFRFDGTYEREVKEFLWRDDVAELLLALDSTGGYARIEDETLKIARTGSVPSQHDGHELVDWAVAWVHELENAEGSEREQTDPEAPGKWSPPDSE